jgi:hypothetical protein
MVPLNLAGVQMEQWKSGRLKSGSGGLGITSPIYKTHSFIDWMGQNSGCVTFIFLANTEFHGIHLSPRQQVRLST